MTMRVRYAMQFTAMLVLAGCGLSAVPEHWAAADSLARSTLEDLRVSGLEGIRDDMTPETARYPDAEARVREMRAALPAGEPDTVQLVDSEVLMDGPKTTTKLQYVIRNANGAAEADVWVVDVGGGPKIETLRVVALPPP